jgi:uncharacterized lipoprotein YmbA
MILRYHLTLTTLLLISLITGCSTQPSQKTLFYRLDIPVETAASQTAAAELPVPQPRLGVGPVSLAAYLDRPQLISRVSPFHLELHDFHYWAGKLQDNLTLVLTQALQQRLGQDRVIAYPWHRSVRPVYELSLNLDRLDEEQGQMRLQVRWTLIEGTTGELIDLHQASIAEPLQGSGAEAQVAAASRAVLRLAEQLTVRLRPYL